MAVFSANTVASETLTIKELGWTTGSAGPEKFSRVDDSKLSGGLTKYSEYTTSFTFAANTAVYLKATFIGNLDRSGASPAESNYEAVTYEIFNDSVEVEHLYNLKSDELILIATRTATSTVTTIDLELQNKNQQTFYFTAYYEGYSFDGGQTSISGVTNGRWNGGNAIFGNRGIFSNGDPGPAESDVIDYIGISTGGSAVDWGNSSQARRYPACFSDGSIFVTSGGTTGSESDRIDYGTISTPAATASDWGNLSVARTAPAGASDGARGVTGGGQVSASGSDVIDYIAIAVPATTATDFGNLSVARGVGSATGDGPRAVFGGGYTSTNVNTVDYITISTPATTATDFGDMGTAGSRGYAAFSDASRGIWAGGERAATSSTIEYFTIATPSNSKIFGNMEEVSYGTAGTSDWSRGVMQSFTLTAKLEYITISSQSGGVEFGNLSVARYALGSTSGD